MSKDGWRRFEQNAKWEYDISQLGYKYNMTDISASFGNWQMNYIKEWHKKRSVLFKHYNANLSSIEGFTCPNDTNDKELHAYHLYIIRIKPNKWSINRNKMIELINSAGIGTSVHYKPIHMHSYYKKKYGYKPTDFPCSYQSYCNAITLPLYPSLKIEHVDYIVGYLTNLWNNIVDKFLMEYLSRFIASILLILFLPFFIINYGNIDTFAGYPVLFKQERVGYKFKKFNIYKFRTMSINSGELITTYNDNRITGFGRFLRKTKIDELPQYVT